MALLESKIDLQKKSEVQEIRTYYYSLWCEAILWHYFDNSVVIDKLLFITFETCEQSLGSLLNFKNFEI